MIAITFSGQLCQTPADQADVLARLGKPIPPGFDRASGLVNPLGEASARGWFLLLRSQLDSLDLNGLHSAVFDDGNGGIVTVGGLSLTSEPVALTSSYASGATNACFLVEVSDARWRWHNPHFCRSINAQYNVRASAYRAADEPDCYLEDSLNSGVTWTWATMVADIISQGGLAVTAALPSSPNGVPEGWIFPGVSAWQAICRVLATLNCAVRWNATAGTYDIVQLGAGTFTAPAGRLIHDSEYLTGSKRGHIPYGCRVLFHRMEQYPGTEETTPQTSDNWQTSSVYSIPVAGGISGAEAGVYHPLWDDLPAIYDADGALVNGAALVSRAAARSTAFFTALNTGGARMFQRFTGVSSLNPSGIIKGVAWRQDDQLGLITEVVRHPWAMLRIGDTGAWQEEGGDNATAIQPPAFGPTWPLQAQLGQNIRIEVSDPVDGLYDCTVQKSDGIGGFTSKEMCWGLDLDELLGAIAPLDEGSRHPARLIGYVNDRPLYSFKVIGSETRTGRVTVYVNDDVFLSDGDLYPAVIADYNASGDYFSLTTIDVLARERNARTLTIGEYYGGDYGGLTDDGVPVYLVDSCCEDDLCCVSFNIDNYTADGIAGGSITLTVNRVGCDSDTVTVDYHTVDGTAHQPTDYTSASGTLTFNPGIGSQTFSVTVATHATMAGSLTFTVVLDNPTGAEVCDGPGDSTIKIVGPTVTGCCPGCPTPAFMTAVWSGISGDCDACLPPNSGTYVMSYFPSLDGWEIDFSPVEAFACGVCHGISMLVACVDNVWVAKIVTHGEGCPDYAGTLVSADCGGPVMTLVFDWNIPDYTGAGAGGDCSFRVTFTAPCADASDITTDCCPDHPALSTLIGTVTGSSDTLTCPNGGTVSLTYYLHGSDFDPDFGSGDGWYGSYNGKYIRFFCDGGGSEPSSVNGFQLQVNDTDGTAIGDQLGSEFYPTSTCDPFEVVFLNVEVGSCTFTLTVTT